MPRIDTTTLTRPTAIAETRTFTDERYPDTPLTVTLRCAGEFGDLMKINALAKAYGELHAGPTAIPIQLAGTEDHDIPVTPELVQAVATIMSMEAGEPADRYSFEDWVRISAAMAGAFGAVLKFTRELLARTAAKPTRGEDGKVPVPPGSAVSTGRSSAPRPPSQRPATPTSSRDRTGGSKSSRARSEGS